jgi:hypothetical protein
MNRATLAGVIGFAVNVVSFLSCGARTPLGDAETFDETTDASPDPEDASVDVIDAHVKDTGRKDSDRPGCTPGRFILTLGTAQLLFVLDRSGSMALDLAGNSPPNGPTRWATLETGLRQAIGPFTADIAMGAKFFPMEVKTPPEEAWELCVAGGGWVDVPVALNNASAILSKFQSTSPNGGTPTAETLQIAAEYLGRQRAVARAIVLATDGAPNCNSLLKQSTCTCTFADPTKCTDFSYGATNCLDDTRTLAVVKDVFLRERIPVYVLGIGHGGEEETFLVPTLDAMAELGGRAKPVSPKYYDVQSASQVTTALQSIRESVSRCTFLTPSVPSDGNAIAVEVNGVSVPRDPTHIEGWDWVDELYGVIAFFGTPCVTTTVTNARVEGTVACR